MRYLLPVFITLINSHLFSQVNGRVTDINGTPIPEVKITLIGKNKSTTTDFDGNFYFDYNITNEENLNLKISYNSGRFERSIFVIKKINFSKNKLKQLGEFSVPYFKSTEISIEEYKKLNRKEKKRCSEWIELSHPPRIAFYEFYNLRYENIMQFRINGKLFATTNFTFNNSSRKLIIEWDQLTEL